MLITYQLWAGSKDWKVVSEVGTRGELVNLRREDKDTVSMLEGAENVVSFKYSGLDGMQLDRRVFSTYATLSPLECQGQPLGHCQHHRHPRLVRLRA